MRKLLVFLIIPMLLVSLFSLNVEATNGLPYSTYTYSSAVHRLVWTQDAYLPLSEQTSLDTYELDEPEDLTVDQEDNVYIADTGNSRIIKYSLKDNTSEIIGDGILDEPKGVHVDHDGNVYVADFGLKQALQFSYNEQESTYEVSAIYEKPTNSPYFSEEDAFDPTKVVTDRGGNVYVLLAGNINGLAEFKNDGEFFSFFGGNTIESTLDNVLRYMLFDETQRREWFQMIPDPVYNVAIDKDGLILTTTQGKDGYLKLNIANIVYNQSVWGFDNTEDIYVGPYETIFTITNDGYITEYGPDGSTLFVFGGIDTYGQKGLFDTPSAIAVDSKSNIYALDKDASSLQVFMPTEFANLVHYAIDLYQDGRYAESLEPWQEVLKMNALFDLANQGIGDAYYAQADYENAMTYYEVARDQDGYSDAFWEVRNEVLLDSGNVIIIVLLTLFVLYLVNLFTHFMDYVKMPFKKAKKALSKYKLFNELIFPFYIFRHPSDGYYDIKREKKGSNLAATIYLLLFFVAYIYWIYETSFLFNDRIASEINLFQQIIVIFIPFVLWVVANYLVCSIRDGEGKFSDVYQGSAYTLLPMIITFPLVTIISKGLTYNEAFIYHTLLDLGIIITVIYFIVMVKEIHFYDMRPTLKNIFISIFTGLMIMAVIIIVYLLLGEVYNLFSDIIRELTNRG